MSFAEGSRTVYRPVRVLFNTPIYERALQICWHLPSHKSMVALMSQLLRLQQKHQLPSEVTAKDMSELLFKYSRGVQLWEFELDGCGADVRPLLQLVWEVNTSMKMRDIEFEARRLLSSPEAVPAYFQHPKIISQALKYAGILTKQQQKGPTSKLLCPMEVVLKVVPKVLQGFWLPPPNTSFYMPSQQLSKMAVGVTKAVQDRVSKALSSVLLQATFSSSIRDTMVLSIQEKVRQGYPQDVLVKKLNSFAAEVQKTITDVAVREICALFQPETAQDVQTPSDEPPAQTAVQYDSDKSLDKAEPEPDSAVVSTPPCPLTSSDEPPVGAASPEPDTAVVSTPPCPLTSTDEPPARAASPEPDTAVVSTPPCPLTSSDEPPPHAAIYSNKMSFAEGCRTIYRPVRVLFNTPIYERALQICWHLPSYKSTIALMSQLLRLQQKHQLPSEVTAENMSELLVKQGKRTLRVQLWEFEVDGYDADVRPLLQLVWEVNTSMKMRDIEFEARRLLSSPEAVPAYFQHPKIISQALKYAGILTKQHQKGPTSKLLCPMEVVVKVLPKVLQGFWLPPPNTSFSMPSQQLSKMAVGVTKAVQDRVSKALSSVLLQATFSSSIRDTMVLSIQEKVRQGYAQDVLVKKLNSFAAEVLNTITDVAVRDICALFQPETAQDVQTPSDEPPAQTAVQNDSDRSLDKAEPEPDSAVVSTPPCPLTSSDEPPARAASPEPDTAVVSTPPCPLTSSDEPPACAASPEPDTAEVSTPPCPLTSSDEPPARAASPEPDTAEVSTPPCPLTSSDEPPACAASPEPDTAEVSTPPCPLTSSDEPPACAASPEPDLTSTSTAVKKPKKSRFRRFVNWLQKRCCCLQSGDNELN